MKISNKLLLILFVSILGFSQVLLRANSKTHFLNTNDLLISGWGSSKDSREEYRANFKTIDALKKIRKIKRLKPYFKEAKGYAVFPNVGKAGFGIGGARGDGEVFEDGKVIGSATLTQFSFGLQLGAQAFRQIIFFQNKSDLKRFTDGNFEFGASASAALITEGANASADYSNGVAVMTFSKGGLMYEASIGGQKFSFRKY
tara:strand:- start:98 stop:700 length:603 start_codon:yes stop_codon:yes gene_type:complete